MVAEKTTTTANGTTANGGVDQEKQMTRADTGNTAVSQALPFAAHTAESSKVLEALNADKANGLTEADVQKRLGVHGPNRLKPPRRPSVWSIILRQIGNAMTIVLIAAMAVSLGTMDWISGGVIAALVILNVTVGTYTEWQAEKTVASLESVGAPQATVIRKSDAGAPQTKVIPVEDVVPGDIVLLKNGDIVPADGRVIAGEISNLECDEAFLTGESLPVAKQEEPIEEVECPVGDRICLVFSGSQVTKGRAKVVIFSTGMNTEIGKIAHALESKAERTETGFARFWHKCKVLLGVAETTPLQIKLNKLAYFLLGCAVVIAIIVVASTGFPSDIPLTVATYAVAAAVSILPASLIAVVSLTLARASQDLANRNALVRRMDAIEALAGVENVCSDKTGTLTIGKMTVRKYWVPAKDDREGESAPLDTADGQAYSFETGSEPFYPRGEVHADEQPLRMADESTLDLKAKPTRKNSDDEADDEINAQTTLVHVEKMEQNLRNMVLCASLCNQATLHKGDEGWEANGDPTEVALQVSAHKLGHGKPFLTHQAKQHHEKAPLNRTVSRSSGKPVIAGMNGHYEQIVEHPFDSSVKRMSIAYKFHPDSGSSEKAHVVCFLKGAVERVMDRVDSIVGEDFSEERKDQVIRKMDVLAAQGLRVLGFSGKFLPIEDADSLKTLDRDSFEKGFSFLGLAGIYDPPRKESAGAVADCLRAGITPRMLTGDHPATATAIALSIGIIEKNYSKTMVMTGQQFDALSNAEVDALEELPLVVARCAPETKVRMVDAIHRRGQHTVMTGDGVNDSPALKRADVGVGMGTGSDVAKQSSNLVLADDNFATICRAIRKGRSVFRNLAKFLLYLLSGNVAEIIVLLIGLAFKDENGQSVFPLSPVAALWINTLAAGPPALALGLEPTADDAMEQPPTAFHQIFNLEFYIDLAFYGFLIGALSLVNFVIVLWGYFPGDLGTLCNEGESAACDPVFHARAACFATLVIILMIHSFECKHFTRSIFQMNLLDNKVLLWCALVLALTTFPIVYIPVINEKVFLINSIGWEWGIIFGMILVYLASSELYKWIKRIVIRRKSGVQRSKRGPSDKTLRMEPTMAAQV